MDRGGEFGAGSQGVRHATVDGGADHLANARGFLCGATKPNGFPVKGVMPLFSLLLLMVCELAAAQSAGQG